MYTAKDLPWYKEMTATRSELDFYAQLERLKRKGELENLEKVKMIRNIEGYITIPQYFEILEKWDYYDEQLELFKAKNRDKTRWLDKRLGAASPWPIKVAKFIKENNMSDDPEKDLFFCLCNNDVLLYIQFICMKEIFEYMSDFVSPVRVKDLRFLNPTIFTHKRRIMEKYFSQASELSDIFQVKSAKRLNETMSLLLSPGITKKDKITILNYLVNRDSGAKAQHLLGETYPKILTHRVWRSLLNQKNILFLPKENIVKIYNQYKEAQYLNHGLGNIIKKISGSRVTSQTRTSYQTVLTRAEKEKLDTWKTKLKNQRPL